MNLKEIVLKMNKAIPYMFIVLFAVLLLFACDSSNKDYNKAISTADTLFQQDKYTEAKAYYSKALNFKPEEKYPVQKIDKIGEILKSREIDAQYAQVLEKADNFYLEKKYSEAINAYINASEVKPDEQYPIDMINIVKELLGDVEKQEQNKKNSFHIIVGSFQVESNAINLNEKLKAEGYDSRIISWYSGFQLVTFTSHPDIHKAFNNINEAKIQVDEDAWVVYKK